MAAIEYGEVSIDDWERGKKVEFEFGVKYKMEMREGKKDIGVRRVNCQISRWQIESETYLDFTL